MYVVALVTGLLLSGCGSEEGGRSSPVAQGAPRWHIVEGTGEERSGLMLQCRTPVRVRLRMETTGALSDPGPWRTLVAGQTLVIWYAYARLRGETRQDTPPPQAAREGRSVPLAAQINCHFDDRVSNHRRLVFWARPRTGRLRHLIALPPGRYEDLPREGSVELITVALTDFAEGRARLRRRGLESRLLLPGSQADGDRAEVVRVFLDLARVESR